MAAMVLQVLLDLVDHLVIEVLLDPLEQEASKECQEHLEKLDRQERMARLDFLAGQV